jgi:AraC family transcriptional regulator
MRAEREEGIPAPPMVAPGGYRRIDGITIRGFAPRRRPAPATCVLSGTVPDPLLSSRARSWNGITVELHSFENLDALVQPVDHVVAVHLAGNANLQRTRDGATRMRNMSAGDIAITPVGTPVRWTQSSHSLVILLRLSPAYLRAIAGDECALDPDRFEIRDVFSTRDPTIENIGRSLLTGLEVEGRASALYADTLTCELAVHLIRSYTTCEMKEWSGARLPPHKLRRALEYIDEHLDSQVTLAALADVVALSPGHFARAFREATGVAPHRYLVERRVERAKLLLRQSDLPITEIAARIGCSSHSHFSVLFHRVTGFTPRQFRALG